jgi:chromosome segregation ATPase
LDTDPLNPLVPLPEDDNGAAGAPERAVLGSDLADVEWEWLIRERDLAVAARERAVHERDNLVLTRFHLLRERDAALAAAADRDRLAEERDHLAAETVRLAAAVWEAMQEKAQFLGERAALARELVQATRAGEALAEERDRLVREYERAVAERDAIAAALLSVTGDAEALAARLERTLRRRLGRRLHRISGVFRSAHGGQQPRRGGR